MRGQYVQFDVMEATAQVALAISWIFFAVIFFVGRRGAASKGKTTARSNRSRFGLVLQMIGYAVVFSIARPYFTPIVSMPKWAEGIVLLIATGIGAASIWFCFTAARTLGKQWSLIARIIENHELVQTGPFAVVRNPIYLAMFGLLLQAAIVISIWQAVLPAAVAFLTGTYIRIYEEEKILRAEFGEKFDDYAKRVPAFLPRLT